MYTDLWTYRESVPASTEGITGFGVEATDGSIGHIDAASNETGAGYIVVDTGPWIRLATQRASRPLAQMARAASKAMSSWTLSSVGVSTWASNRSSRGSRSSR